MEIKYAVIWYSKIVLNHISTDTRKIFRNLEKKSKKLISLKSHLNFNIICLNENLLPKYTNFKLHDAAAREEKFVENCRRQLIERQIREEKLSVTELSTEVEDQRNILMAGHFQ